jgi:CRP-like cAMP-binding protein
MGLIDDALRMAEARAETDCVLISVSRVEFEKKIENSDIIIRSIIATLSQRLRQLEKRTKI